MAGPWEKYQSAKSGAEPSGPWTKYKSAPAPEADPEDQTGVGQAALEHYGNSATLGYLPHIQAMAEKLTPDPDVDVNARLKARGFNIQEPARSYVASRDANLNRLAVEDQEHPIASGIGKIGGMAADALLIPVGSAARGAGLGAKVLQGAKIGAGLGAIANPGDTAGEVDPLQLGDRAKGAAIGAAVGGAIPVAAQGLSSAARKTSEYLKVKAGGLAETATGATGVQAQKFEPGSGRELLDRKIVRFGDTAEKIGKRARSAMDEASSHIDEALTALDAKGVTASADNVVSELQQKVATLRKDPSQSGLVKKLTGIIDDIVETGQSKVPLSEAEATKRGFSKAAGNWMDPEAGAAGKNAYGAYMKEVERAAREAEPALASKFTEGKKTYGLLAPIQEAAERRGMQQAQSPIGGFGDMLATGVGGIKGFIAKRLLQPRIASAAAVTADKFANGLSTAAPGIAERYAANPMAAQVIAQRLTGGTSGPGGDNPDSGGTPQLGSDQESKLDRKPSGEDRWAQRGAQSLQLQDSDAQRLMSSPKGKQLLIQASDLKPGSKAMQNINAQIQQLLKGAK